MTEDEARDLLVWKVNGTLEAGTEAELDKQIAASRGLQRELTMLTELRTRIQAQGTAGPGELGFERLRRDIRATKAEQEAQPGLVTRSDRRASFGWRGLAVAATVVLAVQNGWLFLQPTGDSTAMRGEGDEVVAATAGALVEVRFARSAPLGEIAALLSAASAQIVAGPLDTGGYRLELSASATDRPAVEESLRVLRSRIDLVQSVSELP